MHVRRAEMTHVALRPLIVTASLRKKGIDAQIYFRQRGKFESNVFQPQRTRVVGAIGKGALARTRTKHLHHPGSRPESLILTEQIHVSSRLAKAGRRAACRELDVMANKGGSACSSVAARPGSCERFGDDSSYFDGA